MKIQSIFSFPSVKTQNIQSNNYHYRNSQPVTDLFVRGNSVSFKGKYYEDELCKTFSDKYYRSFWGYDEQLLAGCKNKNGTVNEVAVKIVLDFAPKTQDYASGAYVGMCNLLDGAKDEQGNIDESYFIKARKLHKLLGSNIQVSEFLDHTKGDSNKVDENIFSMVKSILEKNEVRDVQDIIQIEMLADLCKNDENKSIDGSAQKITKLLEKTNDFRKVKGIIKASKDYNGNWCDSNLKHIVQLSEYVPDEAGLENISDICKDRDGIIIEKYFSCLMNLLNAKVLTGTAMDFIREIRMHRIEPNAADKFIKLQTCAKNRPELYVNDPDENMDKETKSDLVDQFFCYNSHKLMNACNISDSAFLDFLMRKRFDEFGYYLDVMNDSITAAYAKKGFKALDTEGNPLSSPQKAALLDIIYLYRKSEMDDEILIDMLNDKKIDFRTLNKEIFKVMMGNVYTPEEINALPPDTISKWDKELIYKIPLQFGSISEKADRDALISVIKSANNNNFEVYRHDKDNIYGQINALTADLFKDAGINQDCFKKWLNPSESCNITLRKTDVNTEKLMQFTHKIQEDIETLRKTPVRGFVDKHYAKYIQNDKFIIPHEIRNSKNTLNDFTQGLIKRLEPVWERAQKNLNVENKSAAARLTLTIKDHFEQTLSDLAAADISGVKKSVNLTIKMWDRNPSKDLFQGNYSTCCIGMDNSNGAAMSQYLLNDCFNMIEMKDNNSGKTVGNALVYYALEDGKPIFIVDNIEINNNCKPSNEMCRIIRNGVAAFAKNINKEILNDADIPIYLGKSYNDVPISDLKQSVRHIKFLGKFAAKDCYLDVFGGWESNTEKKVSLYEL